MGPPAYEGHGLAGWSPGKGHGNAPGSWRAGACLRWREVKRVWVAPPGQEKALRRSNSNFQYPKELQGSWRGALY